MTARRLLPLVAALVVIGFASALTSVTRAGAARTNTAREVPSPPLVFAPVPAAPESGTVVVLPEPERSTSPAFIDRGRRARSAAARSSDDPALSARRIAEVRDGPARRVLPCDTKDYWEGDTGVWKYLSYRFKQVHFLSSRLMPDAPGVSEGRRGRTDTGNRTGYQ